MNHRTSAISVRNILLSVAVLAMATQLPSTSAQQSERCLQNTFPITAGGFADEKASCMVYDPVNDLLIMGGRTVSDDFGPATTQHGFLYAVNLEGDYKWGRFYYNTSSINDITGCKMSSDNTQVIVLGTGFSQPVMFTVNTTDGTIDSFYSLQSKSSDVPLYETYQGVFLDNADYRDGKPYIYSSFLMSDKMQLVKLHMEKLDNAGKEGSDIKYPEIQWNFEFPDYEISASSEFLRRKIPQYLFPDLADEQAFYMAGKYRGVGSIMRLQKRNAQLRWHASLDVMTSIDAIAQVPNESFFFGCGKNDQAARDIFDAEVPEEAYIFRIEDTAGVDWFLKISGGHPLRDGRPSDSCSGLTFNPERGELAAVIQTYAPEFRLFNQGDFYDTMLVIVSARGDLSRALTVSFNIDGMDMLHFPGNLVHSGQKWYLGGLSEGFATRSQVVREFSDDSNLDTFMMRLEFENSDYNCLYQSKLSLSGVRKQTEFFDKGSASKMYRKSIAGEVQLNEMGKYHLNSYYSQYPSTLYLRSGIKVPRPCAKTSIQLPEFEYYRAAKPVEYDIVKETDFDYVLTQFNFNANATTIKDMYGGSSQNVVNFTQNGLVTFYTEDVDQIGSHDVLVRNCDKSDRLIEVNVQVEVLPNTYPNFVEELETAFVIDIGEEFTYFLPEVEDGEDNADPVIRVEPFAGQEGRYPPFMSTYDKNGRLTFYTESKSTQGQTFYFTIIVQEKDSETLFYPYYCSVRVRYMDATEEEASQTGDEEPTLDDTVQSAPEQQFDQLSYEIGMIDHAGIGHLQFLAPVKMDFLEANFEQMFTIFYRLHDFRLYPEDHPVKDFKILEYDKENFSVKFEVKFDKPFQFGLLEEKDDKLFFNVTAGFDYSGLFTQHTKDHADHELRLEGYSAGRIDLTFDLTYKPLQVMILIGRITWWVFSAFLVAQVFFMVWKKMGLFPFWTFVEYAQLVSYLPLLSARYLPYLYEQFKVFLVSHLIATAGQKFDIEESYFSKSYFYYGLTDSRMYLCLINYTILLVIIVILNILVHIAHKKKWGNEKVQRKMDQLTHQFRYNIYLRLFNLSFLDMAFLSAVRVFNSDVNVKFYVFGKIMGVFLLSFTFIAPILIMLFLCTRFDKLQSKTFREKFNTILLKVDKGTRMRLAAPLFFFSRRWVFSLILVMSLDSEAVFLQYIAMLVISCIYLLYLISYEPYTTGGQNALVISYEFIFMVLICCSFMQTDAAPDNSVKVFAGVVMLIGMIMMIVINVISVIGTLRIGKDQMKTITKLAREERIKKAEELRKEKEARTAHKKREDEEWTLIQKEIKAEKVQLAELRKAKTVEGPLETGKPAYHTRHSSLKPLKDDDRRPKSQLIDEENNFNTEAPMAGQETARSTARHPESDLL